MTALRGEPLYAGRAVAVTGARKGVGRALAEYFLQCGAVVHGIARQESSLMHPQYHHHICDVRDAKAVHAMWQELSRDATMRLNILVNNAAVLTSQHSFLLPAASAEDMLMTNLLGPFLVSREAAKLMKREPGGRIINIGSMAACLEPAGDSIYAACKAGLETLSNVLAKEFGQFGITCNTVSVTAIETDMLARLPREKIDAIIANLPVPRYAVEDDIFNVVDFFASPRSSYVTAQTVYLGGLHR